MSWEKETGKGTGYHCSDSGCTSSVHQGDRHAGEDGGAADLSLAKHNKIPKFLCTDAWSTAVRITSRNHKGKTLQMLSFMGPSAEK